MTENIFYNFILRFNVYMPIIAAFLMVVWSPAQACNVCHSKNPKMVNMHKALGFKDCFNCHGPGSKRTSQSQAKQMTSDPLCVDCHKK